MEQEIRLRLEAVKRKIAEAARAAGRSPEEILFVAATKTQGDDVIREAVKAGVTACGENRVQELLRHLETNAYGDAQVHFIGHLQKNKVRQVVGKVDLIQSVDSEELLRLIDRQASALGIVQDILIEINIGGEDNKSGIRPEELDALAARASECAGVRLRGLMAVPPIAGVAGENRRFFQDMAQLFVDIKRKAYDNNNIRYLSMGMSADFVDAIAEGANIVRIGAALFGPRK
jgi:pyridoxal phosphate enzyme (YggS family)